MVILQKKFHRLLQVLWSVLWVISGQIAFSDNLFFAWLLEESTPDDDVYSNCSFQI